MFKLLTKAFILLEIIKYQRNFFFFSLVFLVMYRTFYLRTRFFFSSQPKLISTLEKTGLSSQHLSKISSDSRTLSCLEMIFEKNNSENLTKSQASLLCLLAKKLCPVNDTLKTAIQRFSGYILQGKIKENGHLEKLLQGLKGELAQKGVIDWDSVEKKAGFHCEYSENSLKTHISHFIDKNQFAIKSCLGTNNKNNLLCAMLRNLRNELPGANSQQIFAIFSQEIKKIEENSQMEQEKCKTPEKISSQTPHIWDKLRDINSARDLLLANNSVENFEKHCQATNGKVFMRFPPEPNGFLHIGHAKAIRANFNSALYLQGTCNLRYDDTNPEKESKEFIENIEKNIIWLGYKPDKITHASDYFPELYRFAVELIKKGKAFVCEQSKEDLQNFRKAKKPSPFRERPIEENLILFENMRNGLYPEGSYSLRLKIDHGHVNPTMRDPVAYRIKYHPHPKTEKQWNIYPTYDFTHCISDSLENISHSLCTLEFEIRRDLYYWILDALEIFKPVVWEYSRLNISHSMLSKRKLSVLVKENRVTGWDDPRLLTLEGLRRRGYTPTSINEFCDLVNVTRRGNENIINIQLLEHCLRKDLDKIAYRMMTVLDPVNVVIENIGENEEKIIEIPIHPKDESKGKRKIRFGKRIFIERKDFRVLDCDDFFGLALNKIVCLKYIGFIQCVNMIQDPKSGEIIELHAKFLGENLQITQNEGQINNNSNNGENSNKYKNKGVIHWINVSDARDCEVRLFEHLFKIDDPSSLEDFRNGLNENSKTILKGCKIHKDFLGNEASHYQFERIGYFVLDKDSDLSNKDFVFNLSVNLKEKAKKA